MARDSTNMTIFKKVNIAVKIEITGAVMNTKVNTTKVVDRILK